MPPGPGPLYNWLCVLHSASAILAHAASIRAAQVGRVGASVNLKSRGNGSGSAKKQKPENEGVFALGDSTLRSDNDAVEKSASAVEKASVSSSSSANNVLHLHKSVVLGQPAPRGSTAEAVTLKFQHTRSGEGIELMKREEVVELGGPTQILEESLPSKETVEPSELVNVHQALASDLLPKPTDASLDATSPDPPEPRPQRILQASRVPSSRLGRLFHYGGLAASLGYGAAAEALRRTTRGGGDGENTGSLMLTPANVQRLVEKLSRMRGAALKLGQFLSIQDSHVLPKDVEEVFRRVQDSAHYMPNWQMERVMSSSLGSSWSNFFASFTPVPFAAASLGQVHEAVLAAHASPTGKEAHVAVKVQFPDVKKSIDSDLGYLTTLLGGFGGVLPKGAFLGRTIEVMKAELADECDYKREADSARFFASPEGLGTDARFRVPWVWDGSTEDVLVMEMMDGVTVGGIDVEGLDQSMRDEIAKRVLELCMKELFDLRLMQTDPNWSNFLWNGRTRQIELIDFGATRPYTKSFIDAWMQLLQSAVAEDVPACIHWSRQLGYLTGEEGETMHHAHARSLTLLATPFREAGEYAFGRGTRWAGITREIRELIPVMLRERLTPPPRETYSLNRKLSGAFLLASRLNASVDCQNIWQQTVKRYRFGE